MIEHVWFSLTQDEDGYPPYTQEAVDAQRNQNGNYVLLRSSAFVYGVAKGDILEVEYRDDGKLWVTRVVKNSENWCSRIIPLGQKNREPTVQRIQELEVEFWETNLGMFVLEVNGSQNHSTIIAHLEAGRQDGVWDFDLGVTPGG